MLRHFLLGVGISLIIIFIMLTMLNLELINLAELDENLIVEQVKERNLDNAFVEEAKKEFKAEITDEYIIEEAKKLGMNFDKSVMEEFISQYYFRTENIFSGKNILLSETFDDLTEIKKNNKSEDKNDSAQLDKATEEETITLLIKPGMNAREIAWLLQEKGFIADMTSFIVLVNRFDMEDKIMAGTYHFSSDISTLRLLLELTI